MQALGSGIEDKRAGCFFDNMINLAKEFPVPGQKKQWPHYVKYWSNIRRLCQLQFVEIILMA